MITICVHYLIIFLLIHIFNEVCNETSIYITKNLKHKYSQKPIIQTNKIVPTYDRHDFRETDNNKCANCTVTTAYAYMYTLLIQYCKWVMNNNCDIVHCDVNW